MNNTFLRPIPIVPNFSVSIYFLLMWLSQLILWKLETFFETWFFCWRFLLLCISASSFTFLNYSKIAIRARKNGAISSPTRKNLKINPNLEVFLSEDSNKESVSSDTSIDSSKHLIKSNAELPHSCANSSEDTKEQITLLTLVFFLSFLCYGVLPGLQVNYIDFKSWYNHWNKIQFKSFSLIQPCRMEMIYIIIRSI